MISLNKLQIRGEKNLPIYKKEKKGEDLPSQSKDYLLFEMLLPVGWNHGV